MPVQDIEGVIFFIILINTVSTPMHSKKVPRTLSLILTRHSGGSVNAGMHSALTSAAGISGDLGGDLCCLASEV